MSLYDELGELGKEASKRMTQEDLRKSAERNRKARREDKKLNKILDILDLEPWQVTDDQLRDIDGVICKAVINAYEKGMRDWWRY